MTNFTNNAEIQAQVTAQIQLLVKELSKCAPHPDRPEHKGATFLQMDDSHKPVAEYDGMLGSMLLDGGLSDAFSDAAGGNGLTDNLDQKMDMLSTYFQDRIQRQPFQLGQHRVIANDFNEIGSRGTEYQAMMDAFMADLPTRLHLEKWIAHETRRLYGLRKQAMMIPLPKAA